mmetsp:Transcript_26382/g.55096  ORF Transcript_26382/g.55096 Transcript_26382/m.55096 type:complete len:395 (-) Transcript_26382:101-1285(-)
MLASTRHSTSIGTEGLVHRDTSTRPIMLSKSNNSNLNNTMTNHNIRLRKAYIIMMGMVFVLSFIFLYTSPHSGSKAMSLDIMPFVLSSADFNNESHYEHRHLQTFYHNDPKTVELVTRETSAENYLTSRRPALPNVLFLGAQKSGSSSISRWLFDGGVCHARTFPEEPEYFAKEAHFFDKDDRFAQGVEFYARRFQRCIDSGNTEFIMDATPDYLTYPERISEVYMNAGTAARSRLKLIVVLREPISRELSLYNHMIMYKHAGSTFEEHADKISHGRGGWASTGMYVDHLKKFASFLSREQLLVLSYDELKTNSQKAQWRIEQFLGREFPGELETLNTHENPNKLRAVPPSARQVLEPLFEDKNEELYEFLDTHPGPWMEQRPFPRFQLKESFA